MSADNLTNNQIRSILEDCNTIAMVGLSGNWYRPSYFAAKYLLDHGYRVIPVNPNYEEILGQQCVASLIDIREPVDVVDLFQRSDQVGKFVDDSASINAKVFWMQLGIVNQDVATEARAKGMTVVMDRCMKIEFARLFGGLNWSGVNTGVITARRPKRVY